MLMHRIRSYLAAEPTEAQQRQVIDRRLARRKSVHFRATIYPLDAFCDARIRDISGTGLMGEAAIELAVGQTVHITADQVIYQAGVVKWIRDPEFGLDLPDAHEIFRDVLRVIDHGSRDGHHPRAFRTKVNLNARLVAGCPPRPAIIRNISGLGMLLESSPGIRTGQHLIVRVGNAPPIYGRTQWSDAGKVGFRADHPISALTIACQTD